MTSFLETGWTRVPALLADHEVAAIVRGCLALLHGPETNRRVGDKHASGTRHLVDLDKRISLVGTALSRRELCDPVRVMLGPGFEQFHVSYRSPQPGFGAQKLHTDALPKTDDGPDDFVTAIVPLVEFTPNNGSTRIVPSSHRRPDLQRFAGNLDSHPDEIQLCGAAGSVFIFSGHLLHSGTRNTSDSERPALQLQWRRAGQATR